MQAALVVLLPTLSYCHSCSLKRFGILRSSTACGLAVQRSHSFTAWVTRKLILSSKVSVLNIPLTSTGTGQHADYMFGWQGDSLQRAMDSCTDSGGGICSQLTTQADTVMNQCTQADRVNEPVDGCKFKYMVFMRITEFKPFYRALCTSGMQSHPSWPSKGHRSKWLRRSHHLWPRWSYRNPRWWWLVNPDYSVYSTIFTDSAIRCCTEPLGTGKFYFKAI